MAFSLNKVILIGTIGRDQETRSTTGDSTVTSFSLATDRSYKGKDGNWINETDWHNIIAWNVSEFTLKGLLKGKKVGIEGRIQTRSYEKDGVKKYVTDIISSNIILLDKVEKDTPTVYPDEVTNSMNNTQTDDDSDLPF